MAVTIPQITTPPGAASEALAPRSAGASQGIFPRVLEQALSQAAQQNVQAERSVVDLAAGRTDSLHEVVLEVAKNDLSFRLLLEIRNRLSDAYQELTKMQIG